MHPVLPGQRRSSLHTRIGIPPLRLGTSTRPQSSCSVMRGPPPDLSSPLLLAPGTASTIPPTASLPNPPSTRSGWSVGKLSATRPDAGPRNASDIFHKSLRTDACPGTIPVTNTSPSVTRTWPMFRDVRPKDSSDMPSTMSPALFSSPPPGVERCVASLVVSICFRPVRRTDTLSSRFG